MTAGDLVAFGIMAVSIAAVAAGRWRMYGAAWLYWRRASGGRLVVGLNAAGRLVAAMLGRAPALRFWRPFGDGDRLVVCSGRVIVFGHLFAAAGGCVVCLPGAELEHRGGWHGALEVDR